MRRIVLTSLVCFVCFVGMVSQVSAESFSIMTEEYPPFNYTEDGKLTGLSSEVMAELIKRIGHPNNIKVLPWARAYNLV